MATSDYLVPGNWPSIEDIDQKISEKGSEYTAGVWKLLQCQDKLVLTPELAKVYNYIQKEHIRLTGYSLPPTIKGAMKTRAQSRDELGPEIKDEVLDEAIKGGMMARLKLMREGKK